MKEAIQKLRTDEQGVIIWNTMSLKWLMRKYQTDNLVINPIDIPAGEYKFMSKNRRLLDQIDSVYTELRADDQLEGIRNKWFYPEHADSGIPIWVWNIAVVLAALALIFLAYYAFYRIRERHMTRELRQSNDRLSLVLSTSEIGLWIYHVMPQTVEFLDEFGKTRQTLHLHELVNRYNQNDYDTLREALTDITHQRKDFANITLKIREQKNNHFVERNYSVDIGVLRRDRSGKPTDLLGTRVDITNDQMRQMRIQDSMIRYQAVFNSAMIDMVVYDADGYIIDMNDKALNGLHMSRKDILQEHIHLSSVLGVDHIDLDTFEPMHITQIFPSSTDERSLQQHLRRSQMFYELKLVPVRDSQGKLMNIYGTGRDVTEVAMSYRQIRQNARELQESNDEINNYIRNIDYVMSVGGIRMARYNPETHTLTIYNDSNHVQFTLTQTRALSYVDDSSQRRALNIIKSMDSLATKSIHADIKTTLRKRGGGGRMHLQLHFIPTYDSQGNVKEYFGMCRDISEIKTIEEKLAAETLRAQEVEVVKNAFLHNMSFEIRTPLNTVVGFAELFQMEHSQEDEVVFIQEIKENSAKLLKLINDILFISRLDAEMIEFNKRVTDFSMTIIQRCESVWATMKKPGVEYTVGSPFNKLVLEVDSSNVGIIIEKIVTNAVQYTDKGTVNVRYDYLGDNLIVSVEDTGCGIPESSLGNIFERFVTGANEGAGLGLAICNELIKRLNGTINIKSDVGKGTTVWFSIPCKALEIERT
jgi:PAS domain S-box-containing protein